MLIRNLFEEEFLKNYLFCMIVLQTDEYFLLNSKVNQKQKTFFTII